MYSNQGIFDAAKITCGHSLHDSGFNEVMKYKSKVSQKKEDISIYATFPLNVKSNPGKKYFKS